MFFWSSIPYYSCVFTGLLTNYFSFAPLPYKLGLVWTLVERVYKINNTWLGVHEEFKKLTMILRKNCFSSGLLTKLFLGINSKQTAVINITRQRML